ncbi:MAG: hypothetical protein M0P38_07745, partial [Bacteroidales bacterium]|nr:hypothetical protein [Bacteroidales bacterium]
DLMTTLGGNGYAGDKMKETGTSHWYSGGTPSNSSGFTALAAGYFGSSNTGLLERTYYWGATQGDASHAYARYITFMASLVSRRNEYKHYGFSVRCLSN